MSQTNTQPKEEDEVIHAPRSRRGLWIGVAVAVLVVGIVAVGLTTNWYGLVTPSTTGGPSGGNNTTANPITLLGAGSSFAYPIISRWSGVYKNATGVSVNYASTGSGAGINGIELKNLDFGATDAPLNNSAHAQYPNLLTIPESLGAVTVAYNLPGLPVHINLTGTIVAQIYMQNITNWNDPSIAAINPGITFPSATIIPVHRSDSSGTTYTFTDYLSKVSPTWALLYGKSKSITWPAGEIGGAQNAGVANAVQQTSDSIGYVELAYVLQSNMAYAQIQNHDGYFTLPSLQTTADAAANASTTLPAGNASWASVSITNAPGANSYPICTFTYVLVYKELNVYPAGEGSGQMDLAKAKALVAFLWWAVHTGQNYASQLSYVPLPLNVVTLDEATIHLMTFNGAALPTGA